MLQCVTLGNGNVMDVKTGSGFRKLSNTRLAIKLRINVPTRGTSGLIQLLRMLYRLVVRTGNTLIGLCRCTCSVDRCYLAHYTLGSAYGHTSIFSAIFTKRNNFSDFLFASLDDETLPKRDQLLKERICSYRSKSFPLRVDPN